ncbi:MAG: hypothetical protein ACRDIL_05755, partial [Candidatus Limnocylindrales bacterium]
RQGFRSEPDTTLAPRQSGASDPTRLATTSKDTSKPDGPLGPSTSRYAARAGEPREWFAPSGRDQQKGPTA